MAEFVLEPLTGSDPVTPKIGQLWFRTDLAANYQAPPASPMAYPGGDTSIIVTWTAASGATNYDVYWGTTPGDITNLIADVGNVTAYLHTGRTANTQYYYKVVAKGTYNSHPTLSFGARTYATYPVNGISSGQLRYLLNGGVLHKYVLRHDSTGTVNQVADNRYDLNSVVSPSSSAFMSMLEAKTQYTFEVRVESLTTTDIFTSPLNVMTDAVPVNESFTYQNLIDHRRIIVNCKRAVDNTIQFLAYYMNTSGTVMYLQADGSWNTTTYTTTLAVGSTVKFKLVRDTTNYTFSYQRNTDTEVVANTVAISSVRGKAGDTTCADYVSCGDPTSDNTLYDCNFRATLTAAG